MCGNEFPTEGTPTQISNGLHLTVHDGYGMFTDLQKFPDFVICHNCSLRFIDLLSPSLQLLFKKGHSSYVCRDDYHDGCDYSFEDEQLEENNQE